jgi:hypothetical protein
MIAFGSKSRFYTSVAERWAQKEHSGSLPAMTRVMPKKETIQRARQDASEGKASTTQAGEFVREEMEHIREGKHGARSTKQAIAIGLSKARRAGVDLAAPKPGRTSDRTRKQAERDLAKGRSGQGQKKVSAKRSRAVQGALKREGREAASPRALSKQARSAAEARRKRGTVTPKAFHA